AVDRGRVVDLDGEPVVGRGRRRPAGEVLRQPAVGERGAGGVGVLPGDAAHGEAVAAVRGDVDLEDLGAQAEELDRVGAGGGDVDAGEEVGEHDDAAVVLPQAQLARRADHPVGDVPVGLARGDVEVAGQGGAGQRDDDVVAHREVVRAADDAAGGHVGGLLAQIGRAHV